MIADRYRIDEVIGVGGMGVVFGARHTWTDRSVALKVLRSHLVDDEDAVRRFLLEAKAAAALRHPNVVDVLDMGRAEDGTVFIALERLEGRSLAQALRERQAPLSFAEAHAVLLPVVDALAAAHEAGIVHRDVKPDNIFLAKTPSGAVVPKLVDFGLAKLRRGSQGQETGTGILMGTPDYMSPEQAMGTREIGPASDVWSVAVVFYECLTGTTPFRHESVAYTLVRLLGEPIPSFGEVVEGLPSHVVAVLDRAMARSLDERFATGTDLSRALGDLEPRPEVAPRGRPFADTVPPPPMAPTPEARDASAIERVPTMRDAPAPGTPAWERMATPSGPSSSGAYRAVTAVRPYGPRIRTKVFPLLEAAGLRVDPADVIPAGTPDDDAIARVMASSNRVLLVPFHGHTDDQGNRVDGLAILRRLVAIEPTFPWVVIMPVSNFASAAMTLALEALGDQRLPDALKRRLIVLSEDDLDARDTGARLRARIAGVLAA